MHRFVDRGAHESRCNEGHDGVNPWFMHVLGGGTGPDYFDPWVLFACVACVAIGENFLRSFKGAQRGAG